MKKWIYYLIFGIVAFAMAVCLTKEWNKGGNYRVMIEFEAGNYLEQSQQMGLPLLTYKGDTKEYKPENAVEGLQLSQNTIMYLLPECRTGNTWMLTTRCGLEPYTIKSITVNPEMDFQIVYTKEEIGNKIENAEGCSYRLEENGLVCVPSEEGASLVFASFGSDAVVSFLCWAKELIYVVPLLLLWILTIVHFEGKREDTKKKKTIIFVMQLIGSTALFSLCMCVPYAKAYVEENFPDVPIGQVIYHMHTPLNGTNVDGFRGIIIPTGIIFGISSLVTVVIALHLWKRNRVRSFLAMWMLSGLFLAVPLLVVLAEEYKVAEYWEYTHSQSEIYETYYVDARDVDLKFPEQKRNLIYIFLESMETSYADTSVGGAMQENYMPELTALALDNITFSGSDSQLNGPHHIPGATFTMGALVAHTAGVPINEGLAGNQALNDTFVTESNWLPGAYAIGDVLDAQGYQQEFCIGSDGRFAGRSSYFKGHKNYEVFDYYSAIEEGYIPKDYRVWWGFEDVKLIDYAKREITDLAAKEEPFNFTMLTVDTHFPDGYRCEECESQYDMNYSNVIACSSRQISDLIAWIQQQPFYENTTIALCGDHLTFDAEFASEKISEQYDRRMYFTIINSAKEETGDKQRVFTSVDMYPTTLSAMGGRNPWKLSGTGG